MNMEKVHKCSKLPFVKEDLNMAHELHDTGENLDERGDGRDSIPRLKSETTSLSLW